VASSILAQNALPLMALSRTWNRKLNFYISITYKVIPVFARTATALIIFIYP
jgi:hypothetical protein